MNAEQMRAWFVLEGHVLYRVEGLWYAHCYGVLWVRYATCGLRADTWDNHGESNGEYFDEQHKRGWTALPDDILAQLFETLQKYKEENP